MNKTDTLTELLRTLVAFRTVSSDLNANHQAIDYLQGYFEERGLHTTKLEANGVPSLIATTRTTKTPKVYLAAHLDVVPAPDEAFTLTEDDGKLSGRGTMDMKFAIAAYMYVVDELKNSLADYDFGIMITCDEEATSQFGTKFLVDQGYLADIVVLPDGGPNWKIEESAKGYWSGWVVQKGKSAHGSRPWEGESATFKLLDLLQDIRALFPEQAIDSNTLNISVIEAGEAFNQIPSDARAMLDIRGVNPESYAKVKEDVLALCKKHGATFELFKDGAIYLTDHSNPLVKQFREIVIKHLGYDPGTTKSLGGTDAVWFAEKGVTSIVMYITGGGHHGEGEWIKKDDLPIFADVIAEYLRSVAKQ